MMKKNTVTVGDTVPARENETVIVTESLVLGVPGVLRRGDIVAGDITVPGLATMRRTRRKTTDSLEETVQNVNAGHLLRQSPRRRTTRILSQSDGALTVLPLERRRRIHPRANHHHLH